MSFDNDEIWLDRAKGDECYSVPLHKELKNALLWWKLAQAKQAEQNQEIAAALGAARDRLRAPNRERQAGCEADDLQADRLARRPRRRRPLQGRPRREEARVTPHVIRRSMATSMRLQGQDVFDVQAVLNHKDPATTLKHYAFAGDAAKRRAIDRITI